MFIYEFLILRTVPRSNRVSSNVIDEARAAWIVKSEELYQLMALTRKREENGSLAAHILMRRRTLILLAIFRNALGTSVSSVTNMYADFNIYTASARSCFRLARHCQHAISISSPTTDKIHP